MSLKFAEIDPVEAIRDGIKLNVTVLVKTLASMWPYIKDGSPSNDTDSLVDFLTVAAAHDIMLSTKDDKPVQQVYVVDDVLYTELSVAGEYITELAGHKVWVNYRDGAGTVAFFRKLYEHRSDVQWREAIAHLEGRHQAADDKWEKNADHDCLPERYDG